MASAAGTKRRLLISMPPRHGKSEFVSRYFLAWLIGLNPTKRVMFASYEATFASSWGRKVRDLLDEHGERVFGVKVRADLKAADHWSLVGSTDYNMVSAGAGGPLTGKAADILLVDDPTKNSEEADSKRHREKLIDWWQRTARPRLEPGGSAIVVATRWSTDDLIGFLINEMGNGGEQWDVINIPAIATEHDSLGRKPGDALWPERYPIEELEAIKRAVGVKAWSSLYQGDPRPAEGTIFNRSWFDKRYTIHGSGMERFYSVPGSPPFPHSQLRRFGAVDLAMSTKTSADKTAIAVVGTMHDGRSLLLDLVVGRYQGPDLVPLLRRVVNQWGLASLGVEKNGIGLGVVQEAIRAGLPIKPVDADQDKVARAAYLATMLENGRLIFPEKGDVYEDAINECLGFPHGKHDDVVDALAHAARMARGYGGGDPPKIDWPARQNPWGDSMPRRPDWFGGR